jgi:hypothetical protein
MRSLACATLMVSCLPARAQGPLCRTSLPGAVSSYCASEAFVSASRGFLSPGIFSALPACASGTEGTLAAVTDSTTATYGATITGSGTNHVLAYCNGTNWTVH